MGMPTAVRWRRIPILLFSVIGRLRLHPWTSALLHLNGSIPGCDLCPVTPHYPPCLLHIHLLKDNYHITTTVSKRIHLAIWTIYRNSTWSHWQPDSQLHEKSAASATLFAGSINSSAGCISKVTTNTEEKHELWHQSMLLIGDVGLQESSMHLRSKSLLHYSYKGKNYSGRDWKPIWLTHNLLELTEPNYLSFLIVLLLVSLWSSCHQDHYEPAVWQYECFWNCFTGQNSRRYSLSCSLQSLTPTQRIIAYTRYTLEAQYPCSNLQQSYPFTVIKLKLTICHLLGLSHSWPLWLGWPSDQCIQVTMDSLTGKHTSTLCV